MLILGLTLLAAGLFCAVVVKFSSYTQSNLACGVVKHP